VKATKFIVLTAGIIGVAAFFLPLIGATGAHGWSESAFGLVRPHEGMDARTTALSSLVLAAFGAVPACVIIGLIGVIGGRFGRGLGAGALIMGGLGMAAWALLYIDFSNLSAELDSGGFQMRISLGMWALFGCLAACSVAGLLALISPDRGAVDPAARYAATIKA
jgi:hypothetical protein